MTAEPIASFSVANINPGVVRSEFMLSVMALIERERGLQHTVDPAQPRIRFDQFYAQFSGPYLDDERNKCVQWFLRNTESDYLLFIDSDIQFDPHQAFDLIATAAEHHVTLLTGVYFNSFFPQGLAALAHEWRHDPTLDKQNLIPFSGDEIFAMTPADKPHPIDAAGAGFLAIHRQVLIDMAEVYGAPLPWFAELVIDGIHMGEDLTFCVRAKAIDHQPYVLPSIIVDHYKTCRIRPDVKPV